MVLGNIFINIAHFLWILRTKTHYQNQSNILLSNTRFWC